MMKNRMMEMKVLNKQGKKKIKYFQGKLDQS